MEVVLDEKVKSKEDTEKLGIAIGDIVCFDPRTRVTSKGYIKSRFLDDKLSVGILLAYAKYLKTEKVTPERATYVHVTVYEEVGHGGCASVPEGVTEAISVDMGCAGGHMTCDETQVSICAKDSGGPYAYEIVKGLIEAAKKEKADYAVDVYPHYGSDVEATLRAGYDVKHGLIGAGVYASHGYERSHKDGVENVLRLLVGYIG
jgi:putative aminopeptidase FrvX